MGKLKCPEYGSDLELTVDVVCEHSQKINNDGSLHKVKNISTRGNVNGAPYLKCTGHKCCFTYDVEHASHDKPVKEFDEWIAEHLEEIYQLN